MTAIYARQSADRKDSISIDTQIETCKRRIYPEEEALLAVFADKGYSGKNIERPELQQMLLKIREGLINKVVVYKLDRISRSVLDFADMYRKFEKCNVEFVSCSENFDTSTPMGKAMIYISMVFAEMERETIQQRIRDNYYARGEIGSYLGGYAPFGYNKTNYIINGKKTYCFIENKDEADTVRYLYKQFTEEHKNMSELARELNNPCGESKKSIKTRRGEWNQVGISRILSNPTYVKADEGVYIYLKEKGAKINNSAEDFLGVNGVYVYGNPATRKGTKFRVYENQFATIAPHNGIVESTLWLSTQERISRQGGVNRGWGSLSWLQGLIRCECGYSQYVKHIKNKYSDIKYFYCRGKKQGTCNFSTKMLRVDILEAQAEKIIFKSVGGGIISEWHSYDVAYKKRVAFDLIKEIRVKGAEVDIIMK